MAEIGIKYTQVHDDILRIIDEAGQEGIYLDVVREKMKGLYAGKPIEEQIDELYLRQAFESIDAGTGEKDIEEQSKLSRCTERGRRMRHDWGKKPKAAQLKDGQPRDPETGKVLTPVDLGQAAAAKPKRVKPPAAKPTAAK